MNIALKNATVVPGTGDQPIESGTVLVEGERIAWVGPSADAPENEAEQIDCTDKTILPGLCDATPT
jgi:imidazolonepropionase-like amidohydrolase